MTNPTDRTGRREGGFTLIELTVVLLLLALVVAMAAPSVSGYVDRSRTRRALDRLVTDIAYTRQVAMQQGRRVRLRIVSPTTYQVDTLSFAGSWGQLKIVDLTTDFTGVDLSQGVSTLEFTSRGLLSAQSDTGFVKISRQARRDSVFVLPTGRIHRAY
jgi:prepilin-type N-terminal cleavage/methylation domain-containing protein